MHGLYATMNKEQVRRARRIHKLAKNRAGELVVLLQRIIEFSAKHEQSQDNPGALSWAERRDLAIFAADDFLSRIL